MKCVYKYNLYFSSSDAFGTSELNCTSSIETLMYQNTRIDRRIQALEPNFRIAFQWIQRKEQSTDQIRSQIGRRNQPISTLRTKTNKQSVSVFFPLLPLCFFDSLLNVRPQYDEVTTFDLYPKRLYSHEIMTRGQKTLFGVLMTDPRPRETFKHKKGQVQMIFLKFDGFTMRTRAISLNCRYHQPEKSKKMTTEHSNEASDRCHYYTEKENTWGLTIYVMHREIWLPSFPLPSVEDDS